jgi:hypothetical protein
MSVLLTRTLPECTFSDFHDPRHASLQNNLFMILYLFLRHSTGRGGVGNLTLEPPSTEGAVHPHGADHPHASHSHDYTSTGRGGTGNISRDHSQVRT